MNTALKHNELLHPHVRREVLKLFDTMSNKHTLAFREISMKLPHYSEEIIRDVILVLVTEKELDELRLNDGPLVTILYSCRPAFIVRHFIPLFASTFDWMVEARNGELIARCHRETHARMIANALNRK